ncbi:MAG: hypothetical protein JSV06_11390, partial [Myxococcales bacterium]
VVKNKLAPPFRKVEFDIRYGEGIDAVGDLLDRAVEAGIIEKSGAYYRFKGKNIAQGRENARTAVESDGKLRDGISSQLKALTQTTERAA